MDEQTEHDVSEIGRARELPPDEFFPDNDTPSRYLEARSYLRDAIDYLMGREIDPEEAIRCAREAIARIEAEL